MTSKFKQDFCKTKDANVLLREKVESIRDEFKATTTVLGLTSPETEEIARDLTAAIEIYKDVEAQMDRFAAAPTVSDTADAYTAVAINDDLGKATLIMSGVNKKMDALYKNSFK